VQIRKNTFVELQEANAQRPVGINHFGVHVENMNLVLPMFKQRGGNISEARNFRGSILANITDPSHATLAGCEACSETAEFP
jgi:hypothetical protein